MELFVARIFDGFANGATYGLIALALVLIYKATTLINFAQGEMAMFGAFIVLVLATERGVPMWLAVLIGMVISAAIGAGIERTLIRPFDPSDHLPLVIITLGLFLVFGALAQHRIESQPQEGRNHGKNDNFDNHLIYPVFWQANNSPIYAPHPLDRAFH